MRTGSITMTIALALVLGAFIANPLVAQCGSEGHTCTTACSEDAGAATAAISIDDLTKDELTLIKYIANMVEKSQRVEFDPVTFATATGLSVDTILGFDQARIEAGLFAVLESRGFDTSNMQIAGGDGCSAGNCGEFGACSVEANLMAAKGGELAKYQAEKDSDGKSFMGWRAPDFTLTSTAGQEVSLSDYRGKPVALVLMATHCGHCVDTVPILAKLREKYASQDLVVLPVVVNARSEDRVKKWAKSIGADFPVLIATGDELANKYDTRLVPAMFLINGDGWVTKKLVTFKTEQALDIAFGNLVKISAGSASGSK